MSSSSPHARCSPRDGPATPARRAHHSTPHRFAARSAVRGRLQRMRPFVHTWSTVDAATPRASHVQGVAAGGASNESWPCVIQLRKALRPISLQVEVQRAPASLTGTWVLPAPARRLRHERARRGRRARRDGAARTQHAHRVRRRGAAPARRWRRAAAENRRRQPAEHRRLGRGAQMGGAARRRLRAALLVPPHRSRVASPATTFGRRRPVRFLAHYTLSPARTPRSPPTTRASRAAAASATRRRCSRARWRRQTRTQPERCAGF